MSKKNTTNKSFPLEVRSTAVRMVTEQRSKHNSQWAAIELIAARIGCSAPTLHAWPRKHETDTGQRDGTTTNDRNRLKELERESKELHQANEILRKASAFFAQAECVRQPLLRRPK